MNLKIADSCKKGTAQFLTIPFLSVKIFYDIRKLVLKVACSCENHSDAVFVTSFDGFLVTD